MNIQWENFYEHISVEESQEHSYFVMRLTTLWGEDCLEIDKQEHSQ